MNNDLLELYSDYLLSAFPHTTATDLSAMTGGEVSHDRITRFLASKQLDSRALWRLVKPLVHQLEDENEHSGVLIIDDTIHREEALHRRERAYLLALRSLKRSIRQRHQPHQHTLPGRGYLHPSGLRVGQKERVGLQRKEGEEVAEVAEVAEGDLVHVPSGVSHGLDSTSERERFVYVTVATASEKEVL